MASSKLSRFDLPGFTLPLNFIPHKAYLKRFYDVASSTTKAIEVPASGEERDLFPSALDPGDSDSQYEPLSRDYRSPLTLTRLSLTTLREFTMIQMMNHITDKPGWDTKVQPAQKCLVFYAPKTDMLCTPLTLHVLIGL
jgi:hypothetical protein